MLDAQLALQAGLRQEVVGVDGIVLGADAVHAAHALDETDGVPMQVVVDDVVGVLKVEALAENIGGDQDA
jgi:hypothetical protein